MLDAGYGTLVLKARSVAHPFRNSFEQALRTVVVFPEQIEPGVAAAEGIRALRIP